MINKYYLYLRSQARESSQKEVRLGVGSKPLLSSVLSTRSRILTRDGEEGLVKTPQHGHCIIAAKTIDDLR